MKKMILVISAMTAFVGAAQASAKKEEALCERGMKTVYTCLSTPKAGDHKVAGEMAERIDICTKGSTTYIALLGGGESVIDETVPSVRVGATVYPIGDMGNLSIGGRPGKISARFYMNMGASEALSSTFTCVRGN